MLGIPDDATPAEARRAYRQLARKLHPDVNAAPDAAEQFRELTEAWARVSSPGWQRRSESRRTVGGLVGISVEVSFRPLFGDD